MNLAAVKICWAMEHLWKPLDSTQEKLRRTWGGQRSLRWAPEFDVVFQGWKEGADVTC